MFYKDYEFVKIVVVVVVGPLVVRFPVRIVFVVAAMPGPPSKTESRVECTGWGPGLGFDAKTAQHSIVAAVTPPHRDGAFRVDECGTSPIFLSDDVSERSDDGSVDSILGTQLSGLCAQQLAFQSDARQVIQTPASERGGDTVRAGDIDARSASLCPGVPEQSPDGQVAGAADHDSSGTGIAASFATMLVHCLRHSGSWEDFTDRQDLACINTYRMLG